MCYKPITTKLNKRYLNAATLKGAPLKGLFEVPCGNCEQCKTQKVNEWSFRLLEEAKETFRLGGFSIFDTLTYDNLHVPTVGKVLFQLGEFSLDVNSSVCDMLCNSKRDVQLFFKRLRSLYDGPIRYYLVSEYGNDDMFTHRPHYHVQFFFPSPTITPEQASKLIKQAWQNGLTVVIVDKSLAGNELSICPSVMSYDTLIKKDSMLNTPPCWCIYMLGLMLDWLASVGGVGEMEKIKSARAAKLYDYLDNSGLFIPHAEPGSRSDMNITFRTGSDELDAEFVKGAAEHGLLNVKGHRLTGGMRASLYNAMPMEGVDALIDFMKRFEAEHNV